MDFANEKEDVQADFQVFYHETMLEEEVNTDLLYKVEKDLRAYHIYDDTDIQAFCDVYFARGAQSADAQGLLVSKALPAVQRYQEKTRDDQYQIRRTMRNFCKWYQYVSQIVRMFDKELHREFVYCSFLVGLLSVEVVVMDNIAELLTLEMYKLEKPSTVISVLVKNAASMKLQPPATVVRPNKKTRSMRSLSGSTRSIRANLPMVTAL